MLEEQWCADSSAGPTKPGSSSLLPPPVLLSATETSMEFSLPPLDPEMSKQVAYYRLFGRVASGSCVKVREADKLFPGLGMEVSTGLLKWRVWMNMGLMEWRKGGVSTGLLVVCVCVN